MKQLLIGTLLAILVTAGGAGCALIIDPDLQDSTTEGWE